MVVIKLHKIIAFMEDHNLISRGENSYDSGNVFSCNFIMGVLSGKVKASMKNVIRNVEIYFDNSEIKSAKCTCPRGLTKCSHMAALLIWGHKNISSTDVECSWKKKVTKDEEINAIDDLYPDNSMIFENSSCDLKALFLQNVKECKQVVGFTWLLSPEPSITEISILLLEDVIFSKEFRNEKNKKCLLNLLFAIDLNEIKKIAVETKGQSENIKWCLYRQYRLTASNFHKVLACIKKNKPSFPRSLYQTLLGQYNLDSIKSIQWGRTHETTAIKECQKKYKIDIESTGIWLHETGLLGASPDGLTYIKGSQVCIEVKCPYKYRDLNLKECLTDCKDYIVYFDKELDDFNLNDKHPYYDQIQGEIYLSKSSYAILIIWTPLMMVVVQIEKDPEWCSNIDL